MSFITPEFIQRYEEILREDPRSKVFAPLAEAFRKQGDLERAYEISRQGLSYHPEFSAGLVSHARICWEMDLHDEAYQAALKATKYGPENLSAHSLLAEICLELKQPKEALRALKMVLFLNPYDLKAQKTVQRLESLTADEFDEESFQMVRPLDMGARLADASNLEELTEGAHSSGYSPHAISQAELLKSIERVATLVDAFLVRNEFEKAEQSLLQAIQNFGSHPELSQRLEMLREQEFDGDDIEPIDPLPSREEQIRQKKIAKLEHLLHKIKQESYLHS